MSGNSIDDGFSNRVNPKLRGAITVPVLGEFEGASTQPLVVVRGKFTMPRFPDIHGVLKSQEVNAE